MIATNSLYSVPFSSFKNLQTIPVCRRLPALLGADNFSFVCTHPTYQVCGSDFVLWIHAADDHDMSQDNRIHQFHLQRNCFFPLVVVIVMNERPQSHNSRGLQLIRILYHCIIRHSNSLFSNRQHRFLEFS